MKSLNGGEVGILVKDVFNHNLRLALQSLMEGLYSLGEILSSASRCRKERRRGGY